jgi:hypothetical protein
MVVGFKYTATRYHVTAIDLRTWRRSDSGSEYTPTRRIGLTSNGSLAWLDYYGDSARPVPYSVHALTAGAEEPVLLDSGSDIDPTSLAVGRGRVYWIKAGAARTAPLP